MEALRGSRIDDFPFARGLLPFQGFREVAAAARHRHVLFAGDIVAEGLGCFFFLCGGLFCILAVITRCILAKKKVHYRLKRRKRKNLYNHLYLLASTLNTSSYN
jgi:hypothetical protein